jgi:hypothetical protein
MDRATFVYRWAEGEGLLLKHKDLNPEQILDLYGEVVPCNCRAADCPGWQMRQKVPPIPADAGSESQRLRL